MPTFVTYGKTEISGINGNETFTASNTESASGSTIQLSLDSLYNTSQKITNDLIHQINPNTPPKITDYKLNVEEIVILNKHDDSNNIEKEQKYLQTLTEFDYYYTYYDEEYILYEPTNYLNDVFSVSFNFWFSKEDKIYPYFYFVKDNVIYEKELTAYHTKINGFLNITFGPFQKMVQENRPDQVYIAIKTNKKIIFFKHHRIPNFNDYRFIPDSVINLNLMLASCWRINPAYNFPGPRDPELYNEFTKVAKDSNANFILSTGDVVYQESLNVTSQTACQSAYSQLRSYSRLQGTFSNHTWLNCNDDHEFSVNDGCKNGPIIKILRNTFTENFPLLSQVSNEYRANITITRNITFITLDDVSCRTLNPNLTSSNKYLTILGPSQMQFLFDALSNVLLNFRENALCFILVGKTLFGEGSQAFINCPDEREKILNYIKSLGLRNVCFLCGDSHFSDVSECVLNENTNQIVREIRCSALGSIPRLGDINKNRVEGSLVVRNNFGKINIEGPYTEYNVFYTDYVVDGPVYSYKWNTNY